MPIHLKSGLLAHSGTLKKNLEAYPWILDLRTSPMLAPHFIDVENEAQGSQASQWQKLNISWEPSGPLGLPPPNVSPALCLRVHMG